jgi:hypothetical protein
MRDDKGRLLRDDDDQVVAHYNRADAGYRARTERLTFLRTILMVREALSGDEGIEWETDPAKFELPKDYEDYAAALAREVGGTLLGGQVHKILRAANEMSGLVGEEVDKATRLFPD